MGSNEDNSIHVLISDNNQDKLGSFIPMDGDYMAIMRKLGKINIYIYLTLNNFNFFMIRWRIWLYWTKSWR